MKSRALLWMFVLALCGSALAGTEKAPGKIVDSGSFGVFIGGRRVATEVFQIEQRTDGSTVTSEIHTDVPPEATQKAELTLAPNGDLRRYSWNEVKPGKASSVIEPADQLLIAKMSDGSDKIEEHPYILTASTSILDDYFFSHRELLAWRYMAAGCNGGTCRIGGKWQAAALLPRERTSVLVVVEYRGIEPVAIRGEQKQLHRINLDIEGDQWSLWLDDQLKLVRIVIPAAKTEVVRD